MPCLVPTAVTGSSELAQRAPVTALPAQPCQQEWGHARDGWDHAWRELRQVKRAQSESKSEDTYLSKP